MTCDRHVDMSITNTVTGGIDKLVDRHVVTGTLANDS